MANQLLTIQQVAPRLNISEKKLRKMVWSNQIGYVDINPGGRQIHARFSEAHIREFLERNEVKAV